jgi:sterol desaturase/sphingolipid hydroxylase (fatty acid hydroxylase superfamily)
LEATTGLTLTRLLIHLGIVAALFSVGVSVEKLVGRSSGDMRRAFYGMLYSAIEVCTNITVVFLCLTFAETAGLYHLINIPIDPTGWCGSLSALLILMFLSDFFAYWMHRLQHRSALLWRGHALHHSDKDVGVTSTTRLHIFDLLGRHIAYTIPFPIIFGLPAPDKAFLLLIPSMWLYVIHLNINVGFGRFWWIVTSPQFHRVHHSIDPKHYNTNFAAFFPFWDICFRTAYRPKADLLLRVGADTPDVGSLAEYFTYPFLPFWSDAGRKRNG